MPKVLVYRSDLLPYSETFIKDQVMSYRRWQPILVGMRQVDGLSLQNLDVRVLCQTNNTLWQRAKHRLQRELAMPLPGVAERLRQESPSLVHVHFGTDAVDFWPTGACLDVPMVVTLHGYDINIHREHWEKGWGFWRKYPRLLIKMARHPRVHFVAVSNAIKRRAVEFGLPEKSISVCNIGVDINRFSSPLQPVDQRSRKILFVGRLVEKKGCHILLEAFAQVRRKLPDVELVVVGDGPLREALIEQAAELNVPVIFSGSLPISQVKQHMDQARVLCMPSITAENGDAEGLGTVLLEAQASGLPVITSAHGGAQEGIVQGETGFAFDERNISALRECLVKLLTDDALVRAMSIAGQRFVREKFDLHKCTEKLEALYDSLI